MQSMKTHIKVENTQKREEWCKHTKKEGRAVDMEIVETMNLSFYQYSVCKITHSLINFVVTERLAQMILYMWQIM